VLGNLFEKQVDEMALRCQCHWYEHIHELAVIRCPGAQVFAAVMGMAYTPY
jgi:hypothetical protein